jgi:RHS repeat-associated protein
MEGTYMVILGKWSDYDGDEIYGAYTISGSAFVNARSFEPGMAAVDPWTDEGGDNTEYFHTNHLGTTRFMSDPDGDPVDAAVYTAFGERVDGTNHRYGYDGAYGYQAHNFPESPDDPIPYLHVGARYYDPGSGRFLQRDPIGILAGLNVYLYADGKPSLVVDPLGLQPADQVLNCQEECNKWIKSGGALSCGAHGGLNDCYTSCLHDYWPPTSTPPRNWKPWPGTCPPMDSGVPTPDRGRPNKPVKPPKNLPVPKPKGLGMLGLHIGVLLLVAVNGGRRRVRRLSRPSELSGWLHPSTCEERFL